MDFCFLCFHSSGLGAELLLFPEVVRLEVRQSLSAGLQVRAHVEARFIFIKHGSALELVLGRKHA